MARTMTTNTDREQRLAALKVSADRYRHSLRQTVLYLRGLRRQRRNAHNAPIIPFIDALIHAYNGDQARFTAACAEAKAAFAERLDLIMRGSNVPVTLGSEQGTVVNAGEGAMLAQANELKDWYATLDTVERTVGRLSRLPGMWK